MNTHLKIFLEVFRLVSNIFVGAYFENIYEYTFEKILLKPFDCFEHFPESYFTNKLECTLQKISLKPFGYFENFLECK